MWPDLLVDRRTVAERRVASSAARLDMDTIAIERNNIVSIRYHGGWAVSCFALVE